MGRLHGWLARIRGAVTGRRLDAALDAELEAHLEMLAGEYVRRGMSPDAARRAARLRLGGTDQIKEAVRDTRGLPWLEGTLQDLWFGARLLRRDRAFTAAAVAMLAIGIGANVAIFSVVNGLLLRPLPYPNQDRLVGVHEWFADRESDVPFSFPDFLDVRARQEVFEDIALYRDTSFVLTGTGEPERVRGASVTAGLFRVLGVTPEAGRGFREGEDDVSAAPVVVLGHGLWRRRFGGQPVVGRTVMLDGRPMTIVGVMPPAFDFPGNADLWTPLVVRTEEYPRDRYSFAAVAALEPRVDLVAARSNLDTIARQLAQEYPAEHAGVGIRVRPLRDELVSASLRRAFLTLLGAVGLVLLIVCANLAGLLSSRAAARDQEMAVRAALGAGRVRLARQLLVESLLLATLGAGLGLVVGSAAVDALLASAPTTFPPWTTFAFDGRVAAFVVGLTVATTLIAGLQPALRASRVDLHAGIKESGTRVTPGHGRLRGALVVTEVALALVLLLASGLMMRSVLSLLDVDPGVRPEHVLTLRVSLPEAVYRHPDDRLAFFGALMPRLASLPGVARAGATSSLPMVGPFSSLGLSIEGAPPAEPGREPMPVRHVVTPGYFETMGIRLLAGRLFDERDGRPGMPDVAVVNETFARRGWPNADPVGRRVKFGDPDEDVPWVTIVGVVSDVRQFGPGQLADDDIFLPYGQLPLPAMTLVIRGTTDPGPLASSIRGAIRALAPDLALFEPRPMADVVARSVWQPRLFSWLFGAFGVVALALAAIGVYGLLAYSVVQRTREIGLRLAIGADRRQVRRLVVGRGMRLTAAGVAIGAVVALPATRALDALLFGVSPADPLTFAVVALLLLGVAWVACAVPARRATRIDPMAALRIE
jgi:putative ABC transport system permease protein